MTRILWVEDQYEENLGFFSVLERRNATVEWAKSVSEAFRLLESNAKYFKLIVDLQIPLGDDDSVLDLQDTHQNGKYVIAHAIDTLSIPGKQIVCLTSFEGVARELFKGTEVTILAKASYLAEFEEAVCDW